MREYSTVLVPQMSPIHFQFIKPALEACGYRVKLLEDTSAQAIELGLRYVNNDACYPSIIVVGQIIEALKSGQYDPAKTAAIIVQSGGGCRFTNYISLIRKALEDAGYADVPVISFNVLGLEKHDGFKLNLSMLNRLVMATVCGDLLMQVLLRTRPYERQAGSADALHKKWAEHCKAVVAKGNFRHFGRVIHAIVRDFDTLPLTDERKPRVGLVGEIYVKFSPGANNDIVRIIEQEGGEAVMPGLMNFLLYCAYNHEVNHRVLSHGKLAALAGNATVKILDFYRRDMKKALTASQRFTAPPSIGQIADSAEPFLSPSNQTGEGWVLTGEMVELIEQGIPNIVCMQPFACMPNHIAGKGVFKPLKARYPQANITAIDYDPGASEVNQLNRIKLMLSVAFKNMRLDAQNEAAALS